MKTVVRILHVIPFFVCFLSINGFSQTLDWSTSFNPTWADGAASRTATNVGGSGVDVTVSITNSQTGTYQNITNGVPSPAVNTNNSRTNFFIIAGSTDCLEMDVDWTSNTAFIDVVYTFSKPVYITSLRIGDIDKANATSNTYYDKVTITGTTGSTTVLPTSITQVNPANYVTVSGNVVTANTTSNQGGNAATNSNNTSSQQATVDVSFASKAVSKLTIRYGNDASAIANPALQAIAIGNLAFSLVNVSGTIWNDADHSANGTFTNIKTSAETGTNGGGLFINLVNSSNVVVNSVAVAANGSYSITAPQNSSNLTLRLSTVQGVVGSAAPANSAPAAWFNTSPLQTAVFNTTTIDITAKDFGISTTALPVTLAGFTAQTQNSNTILTWKVELQENFDHYIIECAAGDSGKYVPVGTVPSNKQLSGTYQFIHQNAIGTGPVLHYRLKMVDIDGRLGYSKIVTIRFPQAAIEIRPTILSKGEIIQIKIPGTPGNDYKIFLYDNVGRMVYQTNSKGNNSILIPTNQLTGGTYFVRVSGEGMKQTFKMLIK